MTNELWEVRLKELCSEIYEVNSGNFVLEDFEQELLEQIVFEHNAFVVLGFETVYRMLKINPPVIDTVKANKELKELLQRLEKENIK